MVDTPAKRRLHPVILARAKELRRPMTPQEAKLWQQLRAKQFFGLKFRRQHPLDRFILDFFCYEHKLVIEMDGSGHADLAQQAYDQARTEWLEGQGLRVILYSDYLLSSFSLATVTGLAALVDNAYSHDQITRFLDKPPYNQKEYWQVIKPVV